MDVEMPDGTIIEGVPEGVTQAELQRRYAGAGQQKSALKQAGSTLASTLTNAMPMLGGGYGTDLVMGGKQVLDAAAQMAARATGWGVNDTERANQNTMDAYQATAPDQRFGAGALRGVGQGLATAPLTPALAATTIPRALGLGGLVGGGTAALTPVYGAGSDANFWQQKGRDAAIGGGLGVLTGGAGYGLGRMLSPEIGAAQRTMLDADVPLTAGQTMGGWFNRAEEGLSSIPVLGDAIRGARRKAVEGFNRMAYNQALKPIGVTASKDIPVGYEGVRQVSEKIGQQYDKVLDQIKRVDFDPQFDQAVGKLYGMAQQRGVSDQFEAIVKQQVMDRMTPAGTMSATTMKQVESELGRLAFDLRRGSDQAQRALGDAVREVQTALRDTVARSAGPMRAKQLQQTNEAWSEFLRIEDAAAKTTSRGGIFTPESFNVSVHKMAAGGRKQTSKGTATGQQLADDAISVLGRTVPDSGTPYRGIVSAMAGGMIEPSLLAGGLAATLPYTQPGRALTVGAMTKRPNAALELGDILKELSPYLTPAAVAAYLQREP